MLTAATRRAAWIAWDDHLTGFGVRVHPTGRKVHIVKYRQEGRAVKETIGPHGPITPAASRARAAEIVTLARTGRDLEGKTPARRAAPPWPTSPDVSWTSMSPPT